MQISIVILSLNFSDSKPKEINWLLKVQEIS